MSSNYGASLLWMHIGIEQGMQALMKVMFEAMSGTFRPDLFRICGDYNGICYVRDWTGVTGKSWSGFGPYMCKDGAKGSWTIGESWEDGAFSWWYKLIRNPQWTQMLYYQPTMLHREQMKYSLRIRAVSMQVHTNHSEFQQLIHSWCNVYLPGSNSSHSWQNFGQPSRRWWHFSITINLLHWKKDKHYKKGIHQQLYSDGTWTFESSLQSVILGLWS